jgi:hypothetical protein
VDPLQMKNDEPMKVSNFSHSPYDLDTPKSSSCNSSQALVGSFTLKEEGMLSILMFDEYQIERIQKPFHFFCLFYIRLNFFIK